MRQIPEQSPRWTGPGLPWGRVALVEIPEPFWSPDWLNGVRSKTYMGVICAHSGPTAEGSVCVEPAPRQGVPQQCTPFDPDRAKIRVLPGRLGDYT